jgi:choline dehydrogenase-like flavoprotein
MMRNARELGAQDVLEAGICVVGAGIAGIMLAQELERLGHDVLLLEAGHRGRSATLRAAQAGAVSEEHEPLEDVSTRRLGGALALWGGRLMPLDAEDFGASSPATLGWPLALDDLLPWYQAANQRARAGAYEYRASECIPSTSPLFEALLRSDRVEQSKVWRWCPPLRFSHFAPELRASRRIRVFYNALLTSLVLDRSGERVTEAVFQSAPGRSHRVRADTFVLTGGGLEVTRLLLASDTVRPAGLGNSSGHLGRHYLTHPVGEVGVLQTSPEHAARLCSFETSRDGVYCRPMLSVARSVRLRESLLNLNVTFWSPDPHDPSHGSGVLSAYALVKRALIRHRLTEKVAGAHRANLGRPAATRQHLANIAGTLPETVSTLATWGRRRWLSTRSVPALVHAGRAGRVRLRFDAEQSDSSENYVSRSTERDAFGMPRLRVRYAVSQRDKSSYHRSLELIAAELASRGAGQLSLPSRQDFLDQMKLGDGTHQMGLARMASTARDGVVDEHCRLHDVANVYVSSSAVFPSAGAAPPTLTLIALALRLAHRLASRSATT